MVDPIMRCDQCGEEIRDDEAVAWVYNPTPRCGQLVLRVHAETCVPAGWEVA